MCWPRFLLLGSWEKRRQSDLVSFLLSVEARQARVRAKIIFRRRYRSSRALALIEHSQSIISVHCSRPDCQQKKGQKDYLDNTDKLWWNII